MKKDPDLEIVAETADVSSAIAKMQIYNADILVCDLSLPRQSGFELLEWVQDNMPSTQIIVLSMHTELGYVTKARALGAKAFVAKEDAETDLLVAIHQFTDTFYTSESTGHSNLNTLTLDQDAIRFYADLEKVSTAEKRVLALLAQSMTSKSIAKRLNISPRTVEAHRLHISQKLGVRGPNKLLELAIQHRDIIQNIE